MTANEQFSAPVEGIGKESRVQVRGTVIEMNMASSTAIIALDAGGLIAVDIDAMEAEVPVE